MSSSSDQTPPSCIADFCLIPIGTPTASVSKEVAEVQRLLKKSGLEYSMHSAGTTVGTLSSSTSFLGQFANEAFARDEDGYNAN
jgi:uncharacterized protein (TIGR00106 family)